MATFENPTVQAYADTMHINNLEFPPLFLRADVDSATQWCVENSHTYVSYTADDVRFANDGARIYNFYDTVTAQWINAWGFDPIITEITYS
jgi:hypothetical protein